MSTWNKEEAIKHQKKLIYLCGREMATQKRLAWVFINKNDAIKVMNDIYEDYKELHDEMEKYYMEKYGANMESHQDYKEFLNNYPLYDGRKRDYLKIPIKNIDNRIGVNYVLVKFMSLEEYHQGSAEKWLGEGSKFTSIIFNLLE